MGYGDEILAAGMAQRLYERDPSRRVGIFDRLNRPRWHEIWNGNPIIAKPQAIAMGKERVHRLVNASGCRPYIRYPFTTVTGWRFNTAFHARQYIAKIYLTEAEQRRGKELRQRYGPYVVIEPWTKHDNFRWPFARWGELVEACPDLTFVQHTHQFFRKVVPRAHAEPGVFRQVCGMLTQARAYLRSESGLCHAAAALQCPTVTLWGGCMDSDVLGGYPLQISLADHGPGSPCGSWQPCKHCAAIMAALPVDAVVAALRTSLARRQEAA